MLAHQNRLTLIFELSQFPDLTEEDVGLLNVARANVANLQQPMTLKERTDAEIAFVEIGFRLDRLKQQITGSNVRVFNPPKMRVTGPRLAKQKTVR